MKSKKIVVMIAAIFAIFSLTGVAIAKNRVEVKVQSEPIQEKATCDKAGGFSFEFDSGTELIDGDQFTLDLDMGATLCNTIDIVLSPQGDVVRDAVTGILVSPNGWTVVNVVPEVTPLSTETARLPSPVYYTVDTNAGVNDTLSLNGGVFFHIYGAATSPRVTLTVIGARDTGAGDLTPGSFTVGGDPGDKLTVQFLDQKTNVNVTSPNLQFKTLGAWKNDTATATVTDYTVAALIKETTYCINVSNFPGSKVETNIDSKDDKFSAIPSNPQVAHIGSRLAMSFLACKDRFCGFIKVGEPGDQATGFLGVPCTAFNLDGSGYCDNAKGRSNGIYIMNQSGLFDTTIEYQISLTILVNGVTSANGGVYFSNGSIGATAYTGVTSNDCKTLAGATPIVVGGTSGNMTPDSRIAGPTDCGVPVANRAVSLVTAGAKFMPVNTRILGITMPSLIYDKSMIKAGDKVEVQVSLNKPPCGTLFAGTHCVGTFGCDDVSNYQSLLFPYFGKPAAAGGYFYNGMVITNLGTADGTVVFFLYEEDGDKFRIDVANKVKANNVYQTTLSKLVELGTVQMLAGSTGDNVPGNAKGYVVACTSFVSDGFALIGNATTGESTGYLPRYENQDNAAVAGAMNDRYQKVCATIQ